MSAGSPSALLFLLLIMGPGIWYIFAKEISKKQEDLVTFLFFLVSFVGILLVPGEISLFTRLLVSLIGACAITWIMIFDSRLIRKMRIKDREFTQKKLDELTSMLAKREEENDLKKKLSQ